MTLFVEANDGIPLYVEYQVDLMKNEAACQQSVAEPAATVEDNPCDSNYITAPEDKTIEYSVG